MTTRAIDSEPGLEQLHEWAKQKRAAGLNNGLFYASGRFYYNHDLRLVETESSSYLRSVSVAARRGVDFLQFRPHITRLVMLRVLAMEQ